MANIREELRATRFSPAGAVLPDPGKVLHVRIDRPIAGYAVYALVVDNEVKKFGTTGRGNSTFAQRMHSTFSALRRRIQQGPPYTGDPFKRYAPAAILQPSEIEIWVRESTVEEFEVLESDLNNRYRPEWTKEGNRTGRA